MKTCIFCKTAKDLSFFNKTQGIYFMSYCKPCQSIKDKSRRKVNSDARKVYEKQRWAMRTPERKREINLRRKRITTQCNDCAKVHTLRADSVKVWSGRCLSCSAIFTSKMSHVKDAQIKNGKAVVAKYGPPPGPKIENRGRASNHYNWQGGITPHRVAIQNTHEYKAWRTAVFTRDEFRCVACGVNDHKLQADHIKPFALFVELRTDIANGRTLCKPCHLQYGARVNRGVQTHKAILDYKITGTQWVTH